MNEETARAGIRVREAEKAHNIRTFSHGRGAKKKAPNCIQIRVLLWCRRPGSNRYGYRYPRDFKSRASAYSATSAWLKL